MSKLKDFLKEVEEMQIEDLKQLLEKYDIKLAPINKRHSIDVYTYRIDKKFKCCDCNFEFLSKYWQEFDDLKIEDCPKCGGYCFLIDED
jgi:hypothetical protein